MGFNDQLAGMKNRRSQFSMFKEGVKTKIFTGKESVQFRILPAFNPENPDKRISYLPFVYPDKTATDWGRLVYASRFVGHGQAKRDIVSPRSFGSVDVFCPLESLAQAIKQYRNDWGYLTKDLTEDGTPNGKLVDRKAFMAPSPMFICNIIDTGDISKGVQLGCFSSGATNALVGPNEGVVFQPSGSATPDMIAQNYLLAYNWGDVTTPIEGPVLETYQEDVPGKKYKAMKIRLATGPKGVKRTSITQDFLEQRYDLARLENVVEPKSEQEIIDLLAEVLCGTSPQGVHEWALLKMAFPTHKVPNPPGATIQSPGFATGGFGPNPAAKAAAATPAAQPAVSAPPPPYVPTTTVTPAAPTIATVSCAADQLPGIPNPPAASPSPMAPGDAVPAFDPASFMKKMQEITAQRKQG